MKRHKSSKSNARQESTRVQSNESQVNSEKHTTYALWQTAAIANATLELADYIETIGEDKSTLDKIDCLRKAIVYVTSNQINSKTEVQNSKSRTKEFYGQIRTILKQILPYYQNTKSIPKPNYQNTKSIPKPIENAEKLRKTAEYLQRLAGEFAEDVPLETITSEMRSLADDILHYNYPDIFLTGWASGISFLIDAIFVDLYDLGNNLTADEERAKSYLSQAGNILRDFALKRSWPQNYEEKQKFKSQISDDLRHFANVLDQCPMIVQYRNFSKNLSGENPEDTKRIESDSGNKELNTERQNSHNKDFTRVTWNGIDYKFDRLQQSLVIKYLWENMRAREKSIGETIGSEANNFRLLHIFREPGDKAKMHPAWGTMIISEGKGIYSLAEKK